MGWDSTYLYDDKDTAISVAHSAALMYAEIAVVLAIGYQFRPCLLDELDSHDCSKIVVFVNGHDHTLPIFHKSV